LDSVSKKCTDCSANVATCQGLSALAGAKGASSCDPGHVIALG